MKTSFLSALILSTALAGVAHAESNVIIQIGDKAKETYVEHNGAGSDNMIDAKIGTQADTISSKAKLTQWGDRSTIKLRMDASNSSADLEQGEGTANNVMDVTQTGTDNTIKASVKVLGSESNTLTAKQEGTGLNIDAHVKGRANTALLSQAGQNNSISGLTQSKVGARAYIQEGNFNTLDVEQRGNNNNAEIAQNGNSHQAIIRQEGSGTQTNLVRLQQIGGKHSTLLVTTGEGNRNVLSQQGQGNYALVGLHGKENQMLTNQNGERLKVTTYLVGDNNKASIVQTDRSNVAGLWVNGNNNHVDADQKGTANSLKIQLGTAPIDGPQLGSAGTSSNNMVTASQQGDENTGSLRVNGDKNSVRLRQIGVNNTATAGITGSSNNIALNQEGNAHLIKLNVRGSNNDVNLSQNGGSRNIINANVGLEGDAVTSDAPAGANNNVLSVTQSGVSNQIVNATVLGSQNMVDVNLRANNMTATYAVAGIGNTLVAR